MEPQKWHVKNIVLPSFYNSITPGNGDACDKLIKMGFDSFSDNQKKKSFTKNF